MLTTDMHPVGLLSLALPLLGGALLHGWVTATAHPAIVGACLLPLILVAPSIPAAGVYLGIYTKKFVVSFFFSCFICAFPIK